MRGREESKIDKNVQYRCNKEDLITAHCSPPHSRSNFCNKNNLHFYTATCTSRFLLRFEISLRDYININVYIAQINYPTYQYPINPAVGLAHFEEQKIGHIILLMSTSNHE